VALRPSIFLDRTRQVELRRRGLWNDETILTYFDAAVSERPDHVAVVDFKSTTGRREQLTYRQLNDRVNRIATSLVRYGVDPGDVVSIQLPNWWEFNALHLAAMRVGAITNPLMPIFRARELSFMLELTETKILIAPKSFRGFDYASMIGDLQRNLPTLQHAFFIGGEDEQSFERLLESEASGLSLEGRACRADDVCQILFTSGTTGEPKGVMHTSNTLWGDVRPRVKRLRLDRSDVMFMASPLAHQTGFLVGILMPIYVQGTSVLQDVWNGERALSILKDEGCTITMASTPFLLDLTDAVERQKIGLPAFRIFIAGGAPIPRSLVRRANRDLGAAIVSIWGMTECGASTATDVDDLVDKSSETDGKPNPGAEIRVVDEHGTELSADCEGRLQVRTSGNFVGYLKRPQLNPIDTEGWLDTGDLATIDGNGYVRITGRTKDVIIRGGENIPVVEIENLLFEHPAIAEVAIVPYPDERLGERGCAFIVLRPDKALSLKEAIDFLMSRQCAKNYLPERIEIVDELPHTPSGKVQKFLLRELAKHFQGESPDRTRG
jgi:cyclohexanecarboxylate-CoA ligase